MSWLSEAFWMGTVLQAEVLKQKEREALGAVDEAARQRKAWGLTGSIDEGEKGE